MTSRNELPRDVIVAQLSVDAEYGRQAEWLLEEPLPGWLQTSQCGS